MADIFGKPNEGVHKYRVGGLAIVDIIATGGIAVVIAWGMRLPLILVFLILVLVAILMHEAVGVNTRLNAAVFGRQFCPGGR